MKERGGERGGRGNRGQGETGKMDAPTTGDGMGLFTVLSTDVLLSPSGNKVCIISYLLFLVVSFPLSNQSFSLPI